MARAKTETWLPLDRWAEIVGLNPLHFNGLFHDTLLPDLTCGEVWYQYDWQAADRLSREDVARAIHDAERMISREVNYHLMPDWSAQERIVTTRPSNPGVFNLTGFNPRGLYKSVELRWGHFISGGIRAKSIIQTGAAVVRSDEDSDGFQETCTVTVATTITDANEIHAFYPAKNGVKIWEIRPITVSFSGGNAIIQFKIWQIVAANQMERMNPSPLDAADPASFETTVDIYRVYNDPQTQAEFLWEPDESGCCNNSSCVACQLGSQTACLHSRDPRLGIVVPTPASWDASSGQFTQQELGSCREADQVRAWYYSGYLDHKLERPYAELSPDWEQPIAYLASSLLTKPACGCSQVEGFLSYWQNNMAYTSEGTGTYSMTPEQMANRIGTTMGAMYAYRATRQEGVRVAK